MLWHHCDPDWTWLKLILSPKLISKHPHLSSDTFPELLWVSDGSWSSRRKEATKLCHWGTDANNNNVERIKEIVSGVKTNEWLHRNKCLGHLEPPQLNEDNKRQTSHAVLTVGICTSNVASDWRISSASSRSLPSHPSVPSWPLRHFCLLCEFPDADWRRSAYLWIMRLFWRSYLMSLPVLSSLDYTSLL